MTRTRLAVLGSPIAHSKSPALHAAAYRTLGLDWEYGLVEATGPELPGILSSLGPDWRGLSLTMPLKRDVLPLLARVDEVAGLTGGANTVLLDEDGPSGFNTDVHGIVEALRRRGTDRVAHVHLLGAGATAASLLVAVARLGATSAFVSTRTPANADPLRTLAVTLGLPLEVGGLDVTVAEGVEAVQRRARAPRAPASTPVRPGGDALAQAGTSASTPRDLVASTLPGSLPPVIAFPADLVARTTLFDVTYDPWPTALARIWVDAGAPVVSGLEMLAEQALAQVRIFTGGSPDRPLQGEVAVRAAMRASVGLPAD